MSETAAADIEFNIVGAAAHVDLARPQAYNALNEGMRLALDAALQRFARDPQVYCVILRSGHPKAFSAGSDVREVLDWARQDMARARKLFRDEYSLNWRCECFSKPTISLIDGMVMGGGVGISLYGTHRVAGEGYRLAMPETKIGLFPDVGACHALSRMPPGIGMYLGLTGTTIGRADAYALGLVTHCIGRDTFAAVTAALEDVQPVDTVLDGLHEEPGAGELTRHAATIAACFEAPDVAGIMARLAEVSGADADFAQVALRDLKARSPLSLAITHRHISQSRGRDLRATLMADYRLACRCLEGHDFAEGVRALIVDKDNAPRWQPSRIEDAGAGDVDPYFAPMGTEELVLPSREDMQAARA